MLVFDARVEQRHARHRRAVVLVRQHDDREVGLGPQEALVLRRSGLAVGAQRAQDRRELVLEAAPAFAERGDAREHVRDIAGVVGDARRRWKCTSRRPAGSWPRRSRAPCTGRFRSCPRSRRSSEIDPSPAPMSCDTTAIWMLGRPWRILQTGHEGRQVPEKVVLRQPHRGRIVDQEQDVDIAIDRRSQHADPPVGIGTRRRRRLPPLPPPPSGVPNPPPHAAPVITSNPRPQRTIRMRASYMSAVALASLLLVAPSTQAGESHARDSEGASARHDLDRRHQRSPRPHRGAPALRRLPREPPADAGRATAAASCSSTRATCSRGRWSRT